MLLTIYNLPKTTNKVDVKSLLKIKCDLTDIILDDVVNDGDSKKVTVGVSDESDAAILVRKITGIYVGGHKLHVESFRNKPSNQPYHNPTFNNVPNFNQQNDFNMPFDGNMYGYNQQNLGFNGPPDNAMFQTPFAQTTYMGSEQQYQGPTIPSLFTGYPQTNYGYQSYNAPQNISENFSRGMHQAEPLLDNPVQNPNDSRNYNQYGNTNNDLRQNLDQRKRKLSPNPEPEFRKRQNDRDNYSRNETRSNERGRNQNELWLRRDAPYQKETGNHYRDSADSNHSRNQERSNACRSGSRGDDNSKRPSRRDDVSYNNSQQHHKIDTPRNFNIQPQAGTATRNDSIQLNKGNEDNSISNMKKPYYSCHNENYSHYNSQSKNRAESLNRPNVESNLPSSSWKRSDYSLDNRNNYSLDNRRDNSNKSSEKRPGRIDVQITTQKDLPHKMIRKSDTLCGQFTASFTKELLAMFSKQDTIIPGILSNLKRAVRVRVDSVVGQTIATSIEEISQMYRAKFPKYTDKELFNWVLQKVIEEDIQKLDNKLKEPTYVPPPNIPKKVMPKAPALPQTRNVSGPVKNIPMNKPAQNVPAFKKPAQNVPAFKKPAQNVPAFKKPAPRIAKPPKIPQPKSQMKITKKLRKEEHSGNIEYKLPANMESALQSEIDDIVSIFQNEVMNPEEDIKPDVKETVLRKTLEPFQATLDLLLRKRLLDIKTGLQIRIFASPKMPNKEELTDILRDYNILEMKKTQRKTMYVALCGDYETYDSLCSMVTMYLSHMTLTFKPLQVAGAPAKVFRQRASRKLANVNNLINLVDKFDFGLSPNGEPNVRAAILNPNKIKENKAIKHDNNEEKINVEAPLSDAQSQVEDGAGDVKTQINVKNEIITTSDSTAVVESVQIIKKELKVENVDEIDFNDDDFEDY